MSVPQGIGPKWGCACGPTLAAAVSVQDYRCPGEEVGDRFTGGRTARRRRPGSLRPGTERRSREARVALQGTGCRAGSLLALNGTIKAKCVLPQVRFASASPLLRKHRVPQGTRCLPQDAAPTGGQEPAAHAGISYRNEQRALSVKGTLAGAIAQTAGDQTGIRPAAWPMQGDTATPGRRVCGEPTRTACSHGTLPTVP